MGFATYIRLGMFYSLRTASSPASMQEAECLRPIHSSFDAAAIARAR